MWPLRGVRSQKTKLKHWKAHPSDGLRSVTRVAHEPKWVHHQERLSTLFWKHSTSKWKYPTLYFKIGEKFDQLASKIDNTEIQTWREENGLKLPTKGYPWLFQKTNHPTTKTPRHENKTKMILTKAKMQKIQVSMNFYSSISLLAKCRWSKRSKVALHFSLLWFFWFLFFLAGGGGLLFVCWF